MCEFKKDKIQVKKLMFKKMFQNEFFWKIKSIAKVDRIILYTLYFLPLPWNIRCYSSPHSPSNLQANETMFNESRRKKKEKTKKFPSLN